MVANVFDQAARYAVQSDPIGFFQWLLPGLDRSLSFLGWLDTRTLPFPGETDRICDTVAHLAADPTVGPRWALVTEFQTDPEPDMLDRLLEYLARLRRGLRHGPDRREKFQVVAALINMTGARQPGTLAMAFPNLDTPSLQFSVTVRTLREEEAGPTLAAIATGQMSRAVLPWISLMREAGEPSIIELWKRIADTEPDQGRKATYGALALIFAELANRAEIWRTELEGWNMRDSAIVSEWTAEALLEGKLKGKLEGEQDALLRVLRLKFNLPVPKDLAEAVASLNDLDKLATWFDIVMHADSLDDVRRAIQAAK